MISSTRSFLYQLLMKFGVCAILHGSHSTVSRLHGHCTRIFRMDRQGATAASLDGDECRSGGSTVATDTADRTSVLLECGQYSMSRFAGMYGFTFEGMATDKIEARALREKLK